jgi:phosphotransferase system enzyme I (PtsI)
MIRRAATRQHIPLSLCGEMASDPGILPLLVGLGLTEFSMTPGAIHMAKQALSGQRSDDLRAMARRILRLSTVDEIEQQLLTSSGGLSQTKNLQSRES